jgi:hypothetical protein
MSAGGNCGKWGKIWSKSKKEIPIFLKMANYHDGVLSTVMKKSKKTSPM